MLPVLGALVLQAAYGAVDLLVVGQFGSTAGLSANGTNPAPDGLLSTETAGKISTAAGGKFPPAYGQPLFHPWTANGVRGHPPL